ncbi:MAG TPA: hypothetical protein VFE76_12550, partial [Myxococcales bacterium]|nr:hypothetical protein [Myxococcales bacterium]
VSVFPQLFFAATHATVSTGFAPADTFALGVFAPVLFHPAPHFLLGSGPEMSRAGSRPGTTVPRRRIDIP